jgi:hypothetical protein
MKNIKYILSVGIALLVFSSAAQASSYLYCEAQSKNDTFKSFKLTWEPVAGDKNHMWIKSRYSLDPAKLTENTLDAFAPISLVGDLESGKAVKHTLKIPGTDAEVGSNLTLSFDAKETDLTKRSGKVEIVALEFDKSGNDVESKDPRKKLSVSVNCFEAHSLNCEVQGKGSEYHKVDILAVERKKGSDLHFVDLYFKGLNGHVSEAYTSEMDKSEDMTVDQLKRFADKGYTQSSLKSRSTSSWLTIVMNQETSKDSKAVKNLMLGSVQVFKGISKINAKDSLDQKLNLGCVKASVK